MYHVGVLDHLPLWGLFLAATAVVFLSVEGGYRLGRHRRLRPEPERESTVGAMVAATLGLLAFTLAFTFGLAATRFETRREVILEEANAIGTTDLRAAFLPEPQRSDAHRLLLEYVDVRLNGIQPDRVQQAISESTAIHARLWALAVSAGEKEPRSVPIGLFIQSLNEVIDVHSKRVMVGLRNRLPGALWGALYFLSFLGMAEIGYLEGLTSPRRSIAALALVLTFSTVLYLIADLDRPQEGLLRVSQQAMIDLRHSLKGNIR
jgi:hypothetical protein